MNSKHTPGPWRVGNSLSVFAPPQPYLKDGMIAATRYLGNTAERKVEHEANARLIAAAPALLAALEKLAVECQFARKYIVLSETEGMAAYDATAEAILAARAAIAQIKGEQP